MSLTVFEYVWLDGYKPEPNLRSKIKVSNDIRPTPWSFDGSSTKQAEGNFSDCILNPVRKYSSSKNMNKVFVLCEVLNSDGTPHESNDRRKIVDKHGKNDETNSLDRNWFGFEQEYFIRQKYKKIY